MLAATAGGAGHRSLQLRKTSLGRVIVDGQGRTLYRFLHDHGKKSTCSGACAAAWPPAAVKGKATVGKGLVEAVRREDPAPRRHDPAGPTAATRSTASPATPPPGPSRARGSTPSAARWFVVDAKGRVVTKAATASAPAAPAPALTGSGY